LNGKDVEIFIPKFRKYLDESTLKKLRRAEANSGKVPERDPKSSTTEEEVEEDIYIKHISKDICSSSGEPEDANIPKVYKHLDESTKEIGGKGTNSGKIPENAPESSAVEDSKIPPCPHQKIIGLYHEILPELRKVKIWNDARRKHLQARWKESEKCQSVDWWKKFFYYIRASPFLMGQKTDFQADLAWMIMPENFAKIVEGKYHEK